MINELISLLLLWRLRSLIDCLRLVEVLDRLLLMDLMWRLQDLLSGLKWTFSVALFFLLVCGHNASLVPFTP
jgi:hypothetical protein